MGQFIGQDRIPKTSSISDIKSNGFLPKWSILLTKVKIGIPREEHTLNNFFVCVSTPLATSITITALSTAMSVR